MLSDLKYYTILFQFLWVSIQNMANGKRLVVLSTFTNNSLVLYLCRNNSTLISSSSLIVFTSAFISISFCSSNGFWLNNMIRFQVLSWYQLILLCLVFLECENNFQKILEGFKFSGVGEPKN